MVDNVVVVVGSGVVNVCTAVATAAASICGKFVFNVTDGKM